MSVLARVVLACQRCGSAGSLFCEHQATSRHLAVHLRIPLVPQDQQQLHRPERGRTAHNIYCHHGHLQLQTTLQLVDFGLKFRAGTERILFTKQTNMNQRRSVN